MVRLGSETKGAEGVIRQPSRSPARPSSTATGLRCYVVGVTRGVREPVIELSRTHPNLVRKRCSRWRSRRSPRARWRSSRWPAGRAPLQDRGTAGPGFPAQRQGACIGPMGPAGPQRDDELSGEKIDIIDFDDDPARFVANALSPAQRSSVTVVDAARPRRRVIVPDYQLSLAIGREGRTPGWRPA